MHKRTKGFTLVEILIVVIVIVILATISTFAYSGYQNQARTQSYEATIQLVSDAQTKYRRDNGEYMSSRQIIGNDTTNGETLTDQQYQDMATRLGISKEALTNKVLKFVPTVRSVGTFTPTLANEVYMMTKDSTSGSAYSFPIGSTGCTVVFPADNSTLGIGATAYAMAYITPDASWKVYRSSMGDVQITGGGACLFSGSL